MRMQTRLTVLVAACAAGLMTVGCAGPEQKLGRGLGNTFEILRIGELRRSVEQTALFESPGRAYTTGLVRGFNRSLARTGIGLFEVATFPLPPYKPLATGYLKPDPVFPDNYKPGLMDDSLFATDTATGYSGGDIAPMFPGSRFRVFNH